MHILIQIMIASFVVSLISFSGIILFFTKSNKIKTKMPYLVAFAAGTMLGTAFFDLIPESLEIILENGANFSLSISYILYGIILFYVIEKFVHWHHHHDIDCKKHSLTTLSLIGDGFHNLLDGIIIATTFMIEPAMGIVTTLVVGLHEIPQEIGDFSILIHNGIGKTKALLMNFLSGLFSLVGGILTYFFLNKFQDFFPIIAAATAGGFIYIALADIIPSLNSHEIKGRKVLIPVIFFLGIIMIKLIVTFLE